MTPAIAATIREWAEKTGFEARVAAVEEALADMTARAEAARSCGSQLPRAPSMERRPPKAPCWHLRGYKARNSALHLIVAVGAVVPWWSCALYYLVNLQTHPCSRE